MVSPEGRKGDCQTSKQSATLTQVSQLSPCWRNCANLWPTRPQTTHHSLSGFTSTLLGMKAAHKKVEILIFYSVLALYKNTTLNLHADHLHSNTFWVALFFRQQSLLPENSYCLNCATKNIAMVSLPITFEVKSTYPHASKRRTIKINNTPVNKYLI